MKKTLLLPVLTTLFVLLGTMKSFAWPIYDPFNYPPGQTVWGQYDTNTQDYWSEIDSGASSVNAIIIATNVLTYPGLPASPGYSFLMTNVNGAQGPRMFITSNQVNWPGNAGGNFLNNIHVMTSFVLDVTNMANLYASPGGHFTIGYNDQGAVAAQGGNPGTIVTRFYYESVQDGTGTNYQVGIAKQGTVVYAPNILGVNQEHLIVFDEFLTNDPAGTTANEANDYIYLWVDPPAGSFGAETAPAYSAVMGPGVTGNGNGLTPYTSCIVFENRDANAPVAVIGQFRFGTNWSWMTGGACISNNQAGPVNEYVGTPFILTASPFYNGSPNTYQWTYNGVNLTNGPSVSGTGATVSGAYTTNLSLVNQTLSDAGSYAVIVSNAVGVFTSAVSVVTVFPPTPATVAVQPTPAVMPLYAGGSTYVSFAANGAPPITYYWYSNNTVIATNVNVSSFFFTNTSATASVYCFFSNQFGKAYTVTNTIQLLPTPTSPYLQAVLHDKPIDLWPLNEHANNGTGNTGALALDNMGGNDGAYNNVITDQPGFGIGLSNEFSYPPTTTATDTNVAGEFGYYPAEPATNSYVSGISNVDFSAHQNSPPFSVEAWVNAEGNGLAQYGASGHLSSTIVAKGWGNYGGGANEFVLEYGSGSPSGWAFYLEDASGLFFSTSYNPGVVDNNWHHLVATWVEPTPVSPVTAQSLYMDGVLVSSNYNGFAYSNGTNTIGIYTASAPLTIGSSASTLAVENANDADQNFFGQIADVAIYNYALTANQVSNHYWASGIQPTVEIQPPSSTDVSYDGTASISAVVAGTGPLSYAWLDQNNANNPIPGQTNATLVVSNITANDTYTLQITSPYGSASANGAGVTVIVPVTIEQDIAPSAPTVVVGTSVQFVVGVDGESPITYTWQLDGTNLGANPRYSGAASNILTINNVQLSDAGTYQLFASNNFGPTVNSSQATLTVTPTLGFSGGSGWTTESTFSDPYFQNNEVELTPNSGNQDTASFYQDPIYIGGFYASFIYQDTSSGAGNGATFCIQNDPRGSAAQGGSGTSLGVGAGTIPPTGSSPITPSVELELNIYSGNLVGGVGIAMGTNGSVGTVKVPGSVVISDGDPIYVALEYLNGVLTVSLTDSNAQPSQTEFTLTTNINIPKIVGSTSAYVGFTGSTGQSTALQTITAFSFQSIPALTMQSPGVISWPTDIGSFVLQENTNLATNNWFAAPYVPVTVGNSNEATVSPTGTPQFFRLYQSSP